MGKASRMKAARKASGCNQDSRQVGRSLHRPDAKANIALGVDGLVKMPPEVHEFLDEFHSAIEKAKETYCTQLLVSALSRDDVLAFEAALSKGAQIDLDLRKITVPCSTDEGERYMATILEAAFIAGAVNCFKRLVDLGRDCPRVLDLLTSFANALTESGVLLKGFDSWQKQECIKYLLSEVLALGVQEGVLSEEVLVEMTNSQLVNSVIQEFVAEKVSREERAALLAEMTGTERAKADGSTANSIECEVSDGREISMEPPPSSASKNSVRL